MSSEFVDRLQFLSKMVGHCRVYKVVDTYQLSEKVIGDAHITVDNFWIESYHCGVLYTTLKLLISDLILALNGDIDHCVSEDGQHLKFKIYRRDNSKLKTIADSLAVTIQ